MFKWLSGKAFAAPRSVGGCSSSARIATITKPTAVTTAGWRLSADRGVPPTGGINNRKKAASIIGIVNALTGSARPKPCVLLRKIS
jgi:hypothetical protein